MSILDQLCDDYLEGKLSLKPPTADDLEEYRLNDIEEKLGLTTEQVNDFEKVFLRCVPMMKDGFLPRGSRPRCTFSWSKIYAVRNGRRIQL